MKALLFFALAIAVLAVAAPAQAARDPRVPALQHRVAVLEQQLASLGAVVNHNVDVMDCNTAWSNYNWNVNWSLWSVLLQVSPPAPYDTSFGQTACPAVGRTAPPIRLLSMAGRWNLDPLRGGRDG